MVAYASSSQTDTTTTQLGTIVMIELRDGIAVPIDKLRTAWTRLGLPPGYCPRQRNDRDAFRKATPRKQWQEGLALIEYKGKAKPRDLDLACILTRSTDSKTKMTITHRNRAVIALDTQGQLVTQIPEGSPPKELAYIHRVEQQYHQARTTIDGSLLRGAIARVLRDANAVWLRDGVHLVTHRQYPTVEALQQLITFLNDYSDAPSRMLTVVYGDLPEQRTQLRYALRDHVEREIRNKLVEITGYLDARGDKGIGTRKSATVMGDLLQLGVLIDEIEHALHETQHDIRAYLLMQQELVRQQLEL